MAVITFLLEDSEEGVNVSYKSDTPLPKDETAYTEAQRAAIIVREIFEAIMNGKVEKEKDESNN